MTSKEYLTTLHSKYPNTFIGLQAFHKARTPNMVTMVGTYGNVPLDYMLSLVVLYIEYRNVNFLEALCNTHVDNVADNHNTLRLKAVTHILNRLEKFETPAEGKPF